MGDVVQFKSAAELLAEDRADSGEKSWKTRALEAEASVHRVRELLPPVDFIRDDDGEDPVALLIRVDAVRKALGDPMKCPQCGMEGWNGVDLNRPGYSGCGCCGFCY